MLRRLFTALSILAIQVYSQTCFTQQQVETSTNLFTYQGNVYDVTNYDHPGGAAKLSLTIGGALEDFVNLPQYRFHLTKGEFISDLAGILVGTVCTTRPVVTTIVPTVLTTVAPPVVPPVVTTIVPPVVTTIAPPVVPPVVTTVAPPVVTTKCTTRTQTNSALTPSSANINEIYLYYVLGAILALSMIVN